MEGHAEETQKKQRSTMTNDEAQKGTEGRIRKGGGVGQNTRKRGEGKSKGKRLMTEPEQI
jgi:hypothetical protein